MVAAVTCITIASSFVLKACVVLLETERQDMESSGNEIKPTIRNKDTIPERHANRLFMQR